MEFKTTGGSDAINDGMSNQHLKDKTMETPIERINGIDGLSDKAGGTTSAEKSYGVLEYDQAQ